jgi:hypothetical protein
MNAPDIIILVRQPSRLAELRALRNALLEGGATVWTVLVCLDSTLPGELKMTEESIGGVCKTLSPLLAARFGLDLLSRQELADHIENAELVIPC